MPKHCIGIGRSAIATAVRASPSTQCNSVAGEARGYPASTPTETSYDSDIPERFMATSQPPQQPPPQLPAPATAASPQPPSPTSAAGAVMAMMQQLPEVLAKGRGAGPGGSQVHRLSLHSN